MIGRGIIQYCMCCCFMKKKKKDNNGVNIREKNQSSEVFWNVEYLYHKNKMLSPQEQATDQ